jgi:putative zinc finger/helix-turn-helix YgiT family protein
MPEIQEKALPLTCGHCREAAVRRVVLPYTTEAEHDGRLYTVTVPDLEVLRCENCGETLLDTPANRRITEALRQQLELLRPEEIRRRREELGLSQREMAEHMNVPEAFVARWESGGQIQRRDQDRMMRWYFEIPAVRDQYTKSMQGVTVNGAAVDSDYAAGLRQLARLLEELPASKRKSALHHVVGLLEDIKP